MIALVWLFLRQEMRFNFRSPLSYLVQLVLAVVSLSIYWFTSQALTGLHVEWGGGDYFSYLVIGEIALILPLAICHSFILAIRVFAYEALLDELLLSPRSPLLNFSLFSLAILARAVLQVVLTILLAQIFFGFSFKWAQLGGFLILQSAAVPMFLALAWFAGSVFLKFGRGEGMLNHLLEILTVFAGAYFPLTVLPSAIRKALESLSPFARFLEAVRQVFAGDLTHLWASALTMGLVGVSCATIAWLTFHLSVESLRRSGAPNFSHS